MVGCVRSALHRLMCYVYSTLAYRQMGWVGDDKSSTNLVMFIDADFAGCPRTQRSTTGIHLVLAGKVTTFPLSNISRTQSAVALLTPEAEMSAGNTGVVYEMLPARDVCDKILSKKYMSIHLGDNKAMIRVIKTGRNPTMRHLQRMHRVNVASLYEKFQDPRMDLDHVGTNDMAADIYTKGFTSAQKWVASLKSINVFTRESLSRLKMKILS